MKFTACYTKLEEGFGYMGQLLEWPNVITSGKDIEEYEAMLKDAAREMAIVYKEDGQEIPDTTLFVQNISIPLEDEAFMTERTEYHDVYSDGNGNYVTVKNDETFDSQTANALCKAAGIPQIF